MKKVSEPKAQLVAITGGIGSGKSVVSRLLRLMGYGVFDCDNEAKRLMDGDRALQERLRCEFGDAIITDAGTIDRASLAARVFADADSLRRLNAIVHPAVTDALLQWRDSQMSPLCFVETAILTESGLDAVVECAWHVSAPEALRVERAVARGGLTSRQALARVRSQRDNPADYRCPHYNIDNYGNIALIPQVRHLLALMIND